MDFIKLKKYWEKTIATILLLGLTLTIWALIFEIFGFDQTFSWTLKAIIIISTYILTIIIWVFSTKRFVLPSNKFTIYIYAKFDEDKAEIELRKLVDESIKEIKTKHKFLRIIRKPFNIANDANEINDKLKKMIIKPDIVWFATIKSGKETIDGNTSFKIVIEKFDIVCNFPPDSYFKLNKTLINIKKDLTIRNLDKDWVFLENNSYKDKQKIKSNFIDTILYSTGIFMIYSFEWENACEIFKSLYQPITIKITNKKIQKIPVSNSQFVGMRLSDILMNLLTTLSFKAFSDDKYNKAYKLALECEKLFPNTVQEPIRYELLAMLAYYCNEIENSIAFTNKLTAIPGNMFTVYINRGFYAILNNSIKDLYENYEKIINYKNKSNFNAVELVGFLEEQRGKDKLKGKDALLDFAEAIHTKLFIDNEEGNKLLDDFISNNEKIETYFPLCELCQKVRTLTQQKRTNRNNYKKKKKKKR